MAKVASLDKVPNLNLNFNEKIPVKKDDYRCLHHMVKDMHTGKFTREDLELLKEIVGRY